MTAAAADADGGRAVPSGAGRAVGGSPFASSAAAR